MKRITAALIQIALTLPVMLYAAAAVGYALHVLNFDDRFGSDYRLRNAATAAITMAAVLLIGGAYWFAIWHRLVRWTRLRILASFLVVVGAAATAAGSVAYGQASYIGLEGSIVIAGIIFGAVFFLGSTYIWQWRKVDHLARLNDPNGCPPLRGVALCPSCGADMTALEELICPDCQGRCTLDQLLAANGGPTAPATGVIPAARPADAPVGDADDGETPAGEDRS